MSSLLVEVPVDPRACRHQDLEPLGHSGGAAFLQCATCQSIVIVEGAHRWIIRPTDVEGPLPF